MYSTYNEDKPVIAKSFITILRAKIYEKWQLMIADLILVIWIN